MRSYCGFVVFRARCKRTLLTNGDPRKGHYKEVTNKHSERGQRRAAAATQDTNKEAQLYQVSIVQRGHCMLCSNGKLRLHIGTHSLRVRREEEHNGVEDTG